MPRSERFDHFTVPEAETDRNQARHDKQEVAGQASTRSKAETEVQYGKRFAETEAILRARAEERAAEGERRDGGSDAHLGSTEFQVSPTPAHASSGAVADQVGMPGMRGGPSKTRRNQRKAPRSAGRDPTPPLGAMPSEELPPAAEQALAETPGELLFAFADQVTRSVRGLGEAARQLRTAGREVAGLPLEALRVAIRMGRSWLDRSPGRA
jgi:hypothetical protein